VGFSLDLIFTFSEDTSEIAVEALDHSSARYQEMKKDAG
jgi:hypothetical protein